MTTLDEVKAGQQFLFACQVTSVDPVNGIKLALYGPGSVLAATAAIAPDGSMTGSLATAPDQVPVSIVTGFAPVTVGDVMQNILSGETVVCRWSFINPNGSAGWSSSVDHKVIYSSDGWVPVGHVEI